MNNYSPNSLKKKIKSKTHEITLKYSYSGAPEKTKHQGGTFLFFVVSYIISGKRIFFSWRKIKEKKIVCKRKGKRNSDSVEFQLEKTRTTTKKNPTKIAWIHNKTGKNST